MAGFPGFPFSNNPSPPFGFSPSSSATPSSNPFHFSATKQTNDDATIKSIVEAVEKLEKTEGFPPEILQQIKNELKKIYSNISFNTKNNNASNSLGSESSTSSSTTTTSSSSNNNNIYSFPSNNNYNNLFINSQQEFYNNYLLSFQQHSMNDQLQFAQVQAQVAQAQAQAQAQVAQAQIQAQVAQAQVQAQVQMMQQSYMNTLGNIGTTPGLLSPNYFGNTYPSYASDNGPQNGGAGATSNIANSVKMMLEMMGDGNNGLTGTTFGGIGGATTGFGSEGFSALSFLGGILGGFGL